ncbi:hypothetical protein DFH06DRAFT_747237 [Mycena polygramma]|nr:hypothetical protein DFH06DRAFT_747237 [Mycena polygramma]
MLEFLLFWRRDDEAPSLPLREQGRRVDKGNIGRPVLRSIPRRFEIYAPGEYIRDPLTRSSSHRSGSLPSPSVAHPNPSPPVTCSTPPGRDKSPYPLIRSYSLPTPVSPSFSTASGSAHPGVCAPVVARANSFSPLHLDLRRPLSPIPEQTCASPVSIKPTSPKDSEISTLELPRPVGHPSPFIRHSHTSGVPATDPVAPVIPDHPPTLPALNLCPPFPGPHPSQDGEGPPRRPPRALTLPVRSSVYSEGAARSSTGSLHAESFVTATDSLHIPGDVQAPDLVPIEFSITRASTRSSVPISHSNCSPVHLERNGTLGSGGSMRLKRQQFTFATPAFCAFWLGFLFPPIWWVGGWYFTFFSETPASRTLWEHYVLDTRWWAVLTCGCGPCKGRNKHASGRGPSKPLLLPQWVDRQNNTRASLKGISYYYPYVSRPAPGEKGHVTTSPPPWGFRWLHGMFDELTRSRLARVKLERESPRRIIDPWIQRCRRALCYFCLMLFLVVLAMVGWSLAVAIGKSRY